MTKEHGHLCLTKQIRLLDFICSWLGTCYLGKNRSAWFSVMAADCLAPGVDRQWAAMILTVSAACLLSFLRVNFNNQQLLNVTGWHWSTFINFSSKLLNTWMIYSMMRTKLHPGRKSHKFCRWHFLSDDRDWFSTFLYLLNRPMSPTPQCICQISHNAPFCNRNVYISVTKWYIVGYRTVALWDLCNRYFSFGEI